MTASAILFAGATSVAKYITMISEVNSFQITFVRFVIGFIAASFFVLKNKINIKPVKLKWIIFRIIFNTTAVIAFFTGIQYSTVSEANMLNMAYPVFVVILSPFVNKEKIRPATVLYLLTAMAAIIMIMNPAGGRLNMGNLIALLSAVLAGAAISSLREARKNDSSIVILFYLMGVGALINFGVMIPFYEDASLYVWLMIVVCGALGVLGQFAITYGFKYISAAGGSIVSTSRIFWAAVLGVGFFGDRLHWYTATGGTLLLFSIIGVAGGWALLKNNLVGKRT